MIVFLDFLGKVKFSDNKLVSFAQSIDWFQMSRNNRERKAVVRRANVGENVVENVGNPYFLSIE